MKWSKLQYPIALSKQPDIATEPIILIPDDKP